MGERTSISDERAMIYIGAFVLGAVGSVFVACSALFISKYHYDLTLLQYGLLFIPEVIAAVGATQFAAPIACECLAERAYLTGLSCALAGMALLIATEWAPRLAVSYPLLLVSTAFVGAGLGLSFPFIRCYAVSLKPLRSRRQILLVNSVLAAGFAASSVYALATLGTGAWWTLPVLLAVLLIAGMLLSRSLPVPPDGTPTRRSDRPVPPRFRAYPGLALLYGVCAIVCISASQSVPASASPGHFRFLVLVEVGFWAPLVFACRVVFALIDGMESRQYTASIGVFMIGVVLLLLSFFLTRYDMMHAGIYLLSVIGCAALLPIDTRPGNEYLAAYPLTVTVGLMVLFPIVLGLSRLMYHRFALMGISPMEVFLGAAVLGAIACILLLPIIISWPTMGYFDRPVARSAGPAGADMPGALPAPAPRRPSDRTEDASGTRKPSGATALPPSSQAGSGRDDR
jgi:MFS transporter, FHS family, glucose/mannose:H+ symporter